MEDEELYTSTTPQKQPPIDDSGLVDLAQRRQAEIAKRQKGYNTVARIFRYTVLIIVVVTVGAYFILKREKVSPPPYTVGQNNPPENNTNNPSNSTNPTLWTLYRNDQVRIFIRHPNDATIIESTDPAIKVDLVYDRNNANPISGNEADLSEGYIFRVTPLNVGIRNLDSITQIKMDSFKLKCPGTATFTKPVNTVIDNGEARTFEIQNCDSDYIISYVPRFGIYTEIAQIYKGDYGYKQKYRATLEEILRAFSFFPEHVEPVGPTKTFTDVQNKIRFVHPNLDPACCEAPMPPMQQLVTVINLGDKSTYKDKNTFDGFGMYIKEFGFSQGSFESVVEDQKKLLREDYKVVKGVDPTTSEVPVTLGKYQAIMLKGYSWRGNDLVYAQIPGTYGDRLLVISVMNVTGEGFAQKMNDIFASFESL